MADDSIHVIVQICFSSEKLGAMKTSEHALVFMRSKMYVELWFLIENPRTAFMGAEEDKLYLSVVLLFIVNP
jgi:hypothetical protein